MSDQVGTAISPLLAAQGIELLDVESLPGLLRVTVDKEGGITLDEIAAATRIVNGALADPGRIALEVSSPGVERRLRTPEQYRRAIGEIVSVRTLPGVLEQRRVQGVLLSADDEGFVLEGSQRMGYDDVQQARTVFEWGSASRPGARARNERVTTS